MAKIELAISADGHVSEPLDLWTQNLPPSMRERGPRLEPRDGRLCFVAEDRVIRKLPVAVDADASDRRESFAEGGRWGAGSPASRIEALESDGVWGEVLYPNLGFFCTFEIVDPALQVATCRVYNDWVADTYGANPRFAPIGMLPVADVGAAVEELQRFERLALRGGLLPAHADSRPYNDLAYEPLWEAAASLGIPLSFHAGTGRSQTPAHGPGAAVVNYVVTVSAPMETVAYLCASGVLERHPALRVTLVECGAGWLAWTLAAMDDAYRDHDLFVRPKLETVPSDYFRRQGSVTFQRDPVGIANVPVTGDRCLMWGSDYPHPEGTFPHSRQILDEQFDGVPQGTIDRVVYANAADLYGFALPEGRN